MNVVLSVVVGILAFLLLLSSGLKLSGRPDIVESYARVGVSRQRLPLLAALLLLAAAGLLGGFLWPPLGVATAAALTVYFLLAVGAHATHDDLAHAAMPSALLALSAGATALFLLAAQ
jgi:hypothetical protein